MTTPKPPQEEQVFPPKAHSSDHYNFAIWCFKAILAIFIMMLGSAYGIITYRIFTSLFSDAASGRSGLMLVSFLAGVPLAIGLIVGYSSYKKKLAGMAGAASLSMIAIFLFVFIAGALLREGIICIIMAIPIFAVLAILGAIFGAILSSSSKNGPHVLYGFTLILPLALGSMETQVPASSMVQIIEQEILIKASPELVWQYINNPLDIKPKELESGFAYRIGVPFPVQARTLEEKVGGRRELIWQRGVHFEERITAWEANRHIAWTYQFAADSFPPGSLDEHIVIGGKYFNLEDTSYTLTPVATGTRLRIKVTTRVSTNFNWYANLWAKFLVEDTATSILNFYKNRAETGQEPAAI